MTKFTLFATTTFIGSFLLFYSEVLFAKQILPWFGGSASVWAVSLVFFTTTLFFGYVYAYALERRHGMYALRVHMALIAFVTCITLIQTYYWGGLLIPYEECCTNGAHPTITVLLALALSIGAQFFILSSGSVLLISWFSRLVTTHKTTREPNSLYAYSNAGSLVALFAFPFGLEPFVELQTQEYLWICLFFVYITVVVLCMHIMRRDTSTIQNAIGFVSHPASPSLNTWLGWIGYGALGSMMLMSTTHLISQSVAPTPFLWIIPLAVYLLSFVVTFSDVTYPRHWAIYSTALSGIATSFLTFTTIAYLPLTVTIISLYLFFALIFIHGRLYDQRPTNEAQLPQFYMALSLGGALGTISVALVAPALFSWYLETPIIMSVVLLLSLCAARSHFMTHAQITRRQYFTLTTTLVVVTLIPALALNMPIGKSAIASKRNFYGVSAVQHIVFEGDAAIAMVNGKITHGLQLQDPALKDAPTLYFARGTGIYSAFQLARSSHANLEVGIIGLGSGVLASYCEPQDHFTFFELNPVIVDQAKEHFTFLDACTANTIVGDGRLSLKNILRDTHTPTYNLLVLDAFTDDAIPINLLTKEAFELYDQMLSSDEGVIAIHISNTYLDLAPVVRAGLEHIGMSGVVIQGTPKSRGAVTSTWVVATRNASATHERLATGYGMHMTALEDLPTSVLWTDNRSSILGQIRFSLGPQK